MAEQHVNLNAVTRYGPAGSPLPDPETMCLGQCEGLGYYPTTGKAAHNTAEEQKRWQEAHTAPNAHLDEHGNTQECDGWHFLKCPDCEGSRALKGGGFATS